MVAQARGCLRQYMGWLALLVTVLLGLALATPTPVYAAETAQRQGENLIFRHNTFKPYRGSDKGVADRGLPAGVHLYEYTPTTNRRQTIIFPAGSDPLRAKEATYVEYIFVEPDTYNKMDDAIAISVSGQQEAAPQNNGGQNNQNNQNNGGQAGQNAGNNQNNANGQNGGNNGQAANNNNNDQPQDKPAEQADKDDGATTSCSGTALGSIGWIVCPVSNFMAWITDQLYQQVAQYLAVQPLQSGSDGTLFRFWAIMRDLANIAFIIVSLIVIYSQVTSVGISNYGIKKMFPRLVVSIIVVNMSFWLCAAAIDISNILGFQLQQLFVNIASTVNGADYNTLNKITWPNVMSALLTGSAGAVGAVVGVSALVGATDGALAMAIPLLVGVLLAVIIAAVIIAARQALITILVIISPFAFLLHVLPSTEKYFDKWKDLFMTMMLMFPLMSILFGGSRLAGVAILTNGKDANNLNLIILGLAVQVVPLVLTPFVVRMSGSLLGRLGAIMNDPRRGIVDRTRTWAQQRADLRKSRVLAGDAQRNWLGNAARRRALKKRALQQRTDAYTRRFETMADLSAVGRSNDEYNRYTDLRGKEGAARRDRAWNARLLQDDELKQRALNTQLTSDEAKNAAHKLDTLYDELKLGGEVPAGLSHGLGRRAYAAAEVGALTEIRSAMAQREVRAKIDRELLADGAVASADGVVLRDGDGIALRRRMVDGQTLQDYATGVGHKNLMVAGQTARLRKEFGEHVAAEDQLMRHFKLNSNQWQAMAATGDTAITLTDASGNQHTFRADNEYVKEAAIEHQFRAGSAGQKREIIRETGREIEYVADDGTVQVRQGYNYDARATVSAEAVASGVAGAVPFVNDVTYDAILRGEYNGAAAEKMHSLRQVFEGRLKAENFAGANDGALELIYSIPDLPDYQQIKDSYLRTLSPEKRAAIEPTFDQAYAERHQALRHDAYRILNTPELRRNTNAANRAVYERYAERPQG